MAHLLMGQLFLLKGHQLLILDLWIFNCSVFCVSETWISSLPWALRLFNLNNAANC